MPRATKYQQYERYERLREIFLTKSLMFIRLEPSAQMHLTRFYDPRRDHTVELLLMRQHELVRIDPSFPQRVGKAYALLMRLLPRMEALDARPRVKGEPYKVRVFSELRPTIDPNDMAKLLLRMMEVTSR